MCPCRTSGWRLTTFRCHESRTRLSKRGGYQNASRSELRACWCQTPGEDIVQVPQVCWCQRVVEHGVLVTMSQVGGKSLEMVQIISEGWRLEIRAWRPSSVSSSRPRVRWRCPRGVVKQTVGVFGRADGRGLLSAFPSASWSRSPRYSGHSPSTAVWRGGEVDTAGTSARAIEQSG